MCITFSVKESCMNIPDYITAEEIRIAALYDVHIGMQSELIYDYISTKAPVQEDLQPCWSFRDEITIINNTTMKGRRIIIPAVLQNKTLKQLHLNHMGIEKTRLLVGESIYWINMNHEYRHGQNGQKLPQVP